MLRVKGDMRMNILNDILEKEGDNRGSVYLYCLEDSWESIRIFCFLSVFTLSGDENREI